MACVFAVLKRERIALHCYPLDLLQLVIFLLPLSLSFMWKETFTHFFDALYWFTVSLTTVVYGDIYAVSVPGKMITMISSLLGIAFVALPPSLITLGFMQELQQK